MIAKLGLRKSDLGTAGPRGVAAWTRFGSFAVVLSLVGSLAMTLVAGFGIRDLAYATFALGVVLIVLLRRSITLPGSLAHRSTWHLATRHAALVFIVAMLAGAPLPLDQLPALLLVSSFFALVSRFALRGQWRPINA